jgi:hypothetical protein
VIVHRQLKVLDQAERSQDDPDQLKLLFQLDHLATRARRNAENLIILGGGQPGRQWRNAVPLLQVVRSAIGESETYVRVSFGTIPDVTLEGAAVADVVHLIAELVDNATNFSPPTARVEVRGNVVGKGVVIEVEDQGLGIEPRHREELNAMLHDAAGLQRDGAVAGAAARPVRRRAARRPARHPRHAAESPAYGGTRAIVLLPTRSSPGGDRPRRARRRRQRSAPCLPTRRPRSLPPAPADAGRRQLDRARTRRQLDRRAHGRVGELGRDTDRRLRPSAPAAGRTPPAARRPVR